MKKLRFKSQKLLIVGGVAALGLATAAILFYRNNSSAPAETPTTEDVPVGEKATGAESPSGSEKNTPPSQPKEEKSSTPAQTASFQLTLVRAGQIGSTVQIRAMVDGATSGTCRVDFTGPGTSFYKTRTIEYDGRTYSCGPLNAATSEFSKSGTWNYSLKATSGSNFSNTITGQITVSK